MSRIARMLPIASWAPGYERRDAKGDLAAGLTVGAMLVPQAMAYALLAGLPPQVGLYASTVPLVAYAIFGTSRQLGIGPVAIDSLLVASSLAPLVAQGTAEYVAAAALLAVMVGTILLVLGTARLGFLANLLSHSVLVGFTAAAALVIGLSQAKHLFGISTQTKQHFHEKVVEVVANLPDANIATLTISIGACIALIAFKRFVPLVPAALVVVIGSILAVKLFGLEAHGVSVVGDIPEGLPSLELPTFDGSLVGNLAGAAMVIAVVGFVESIASGKVYARRHRYELRPNRELVGLGAANVAAGLFGGYPIAGSFSRTAVNDTAGARTPISLLITAGVVLATLAFLTPLFTSLPNAALAAIIIVAISGLVDIAEMRHIAKVKRTDLVGLSVAFFATLVLGIQLGILVAVIASMLVVFARMSVPHVAVLGRVEGTTTYRNVDRFPEVETVEGIRIVRVDAAVSFVNAVNVKKLLLTNAEALSEPPLALVLNASGINDLDATGAEMFRELLAEMVDRGVSLHLAEVKGPVRDVLRNAGLWDTLSDRVHASTFEAVEAIRTARRGAVDQRRGGIAEFATVGLARTVDSETDESLRSNADYSTTCPGRASRPDTDKKEANMSLHLGDTAPDFTASTTEGDISFHQWKKGSWAVFFSHPADFTPVCTTELGRTAALAGEFAKRNTKAMALSVDPIEDHHRWAPDIGEVSGTALNFPIVADPDRKIAELYDMIHPGAGDTSTVRSVFVIDPNDKLRLTLTYPKSVGRNFDEILRVIDALQATDRDPISTPVDWRPGDRVIVSPAMSTDDAKARFANVEEIKPYLRYADAPTA